MKTHQIDDESLIVDPQLEALYTKILEQIGEDPEREGLIRTPHRAARALQFLTEGYHQDVNKVLERRNLHRRIR